MILEDIRSVVEYNGLALIPKLDSMAYPMQYKIQTPKLPQKHKQHEHDTCHFRLCWFGFSIVNQRSILNGDRGHGCLFSNVYPWIGKSRNVRRSDDCNAWGIFVLINCATRLQYQAVIMFERRDQNVLGNLRPHLRWESIALVFVFVFVDTVVCIL